MRYLSFPILIISLSMLMGCGEDSEPQETELRVVSVSPRGGNIGLNGFIIVTFSKKVASVTIMLNGAPVQAKTSNNKVYRFKVSIPDEELECMNAGDYREYTMNIEATDEAGQSLEGFTPLSFFIVIPDFWPPRVCGVECNPRKGAVDVDPEEYPEKLIIAFNEPLAEVDVLSTYPQFDFALDFSEDRSVMEVRFLNYTMPYETEFRITVSATDLAVNIAEDTYWFTTMKRAGREEEHEKTISNDIYTKHEDTELRTKIES